VGEELAFQFPNRFNGHCYLMRPIIVMMQNNSICQHSSSFTANSGFQLIFKHSTIPCTIDHLPTILVVLEDGSIIVPKRH